jgi:hypothetical protein
MSDRERKSVFEWFRPSKEIREATPAGERYVEGKTAVQYFGGLNREIMRRIAYAKAEIDAYHKAGYKVVIREEDGKKWQMRIMPSKLSEMIQEAKDWLRFLQAIEQKRKAEAALTYLPELQGYVENDVFKTGIQSVSNKISEDDELLAATLSEAAP